jgi:hypothetical protein
VFLNLREWFVDDRAQTLNGNISGIGRTSRRTFSAWPVSPSLACSSCTIWTCRWYLSKRLGSCHWWVMPQYPVVICQSSSHGKIIFIKILSLLLSQLIEAMLAVPQFVRNRQKRSTHGMRLVNPKCWSWSQWPSRTTNAKMIYYSWPPIVWQFETPVTLNSYELHVRLGFENMHMV